MITVKSSLRRSVSLPSVISSADNILTLPVLSFPNGDRRDRLLVSVGDSKWSQPIGLDSPAADMALTMSTTRGTEYHVGLSYAEGLGKVREAS